MLHSMLPGKTEKGSAGEQPFKGYPGQAHQTMARVGAANMATPTHKKHRMIDLLCLKKRIPESAESTPQITVQGSGRGTGRVP